MAQAATVRVRGLSETIRAFNRLDYKLGGEARSALKKVAEPVAEDARGRISRYGGASTSTIAPVTSTRSVFVRQRQGKRGGGHAQFGALQMRHLLGALYDNEGKIREGLEDALDDLTREEGF